MAIKEAKGEIILLGEFNAHYLIWGKKYIASEEQVKCLLAKTDVKGFVLTILKKEPI